MRRGSGHPKISCRPTSARLRPPLPSPRPTTGRVGRVHFSFHRACGSSRTRWQAQARASMRRRDAPKMRICPRRVMATSPDHASETVVPMGRNHVASGSCPTLGRFEAKSVRKHRTRCDRMDHIAARKSEVWLMISSSAVPGVPSQRGWVRSTVCVSFSFGFDWKRLRDSFGFEREANRDPWRRPGRDVGEKRRNG